MKKAISILSLLLLCLTSCIGVRGPERNDLSGSLSSIPDPEIVVVVTRSSALTQEELVQKLKALGSSQGETMAEDLTNQKIDGLVFRYSYALHPDGRILIDIGYYTNPDQQSGFETLYELNTVNGIIQHSLPTKSRFWDG